MNEDFDSAANTDRVEAVDQATSLRLPRSLPLSPGLVAIIAAGLFGLAVTATVTALSSQIDWAVATIVSTTIALITLYVAILHRNSSRQLSAFMRVRIELSDARRRSSEVRGELLRLVRMTHDLSTGLDKRVRHVRHVGDALSETIRRVERDVEGITRSLEELIALTGSTEERKAGVRAIQAMLFEEMFAPDERRPAVDSRLDGVGREHTRGGYLE